MNPCCTHIPILTATITATVDLEHKHRFIGLDGAYCAAGKRAFGTLEAETDAGEQAPVNVLGIVLAEAGGAIAVDSVVESDADGRAVAGGAGIACGVALDAATGAGELIRILRGIA